MLYLSFMRHADSDSSNYHGGDFERPISKKGIKQIKLISKYLTEKNIEPDLVFCSPSLRTIQTCDLLLDDLNYEKMEIIKDYDLYNGNEENFLIRVGIVQDSKNLLIITHEPQISFFVNHFLSETEGYKKISDIGFTTSSIISLKFDLNSWEDISNLNAKFSHFIDPSILVE